MNKKDTTYRVLRAEEITQLEHQGNYSSSWNTVFVADPFDIRLLRNNRFDGVVTIGAVEDNIVKNDGELWLPEGICGCWLRDSQVGEHCALHNVHLMDGYVIGNHCLLLNIEEMTGGDAMRWMSPMNENGNRKILPFPGMTIGDAYLWARYRGHSRLLEQLEQMSLRELRDNRHAMVGDCATIRNTIHLRNVAILSTETDATVIEDCVRLSDGVIGYGCHVQNGIIAKRFLLGEHVKLKYGLRLNDSVVGDNSTLARCEVGCSIIFPSHEQHHNNSFLIAALVEGQSNLAAGATVGSNHNSRTADGELQACRGFWPGLCTSLKHNSCFAAYCLLAKGDYPAELNIPLPFALVNNNVAQDRLEVMPAYWWMYNMFAMNKFTTKFSSRDHRVKKLQHIDFDLFAPDVAEQMIEGRRLLSRWMQKVGIDAGQYDLGNRAMQWKADKTPKGKEVFAEGLEHGSRREVILKPVEGYQAYERMLYYYATTTLKEYFGESRLPDQDLLSQSVRRQTQWVNLGGQLLPQDQVDMLITDIEEGRIKTWSAVHATLSRYDKQRKALWAAHAYQTLLMLEGSNHITATRWQQLCKLTADTEEYIQCQVQLSRQKDNDDFFRHAAYWDDDEYRAVIE